MFDRLSIPTPFGMGPVNAHLSGRTLVDPGPDSEEAWSTLVSELDDRGLEPDDIEHVLITLPHPDHFGLADRLRSAGADVLASRPAADIIADYPGRIVYEQGFFEPLLERHGLSAKIVSTVVSNPEEDFEYAPGVETDRILEAGNEVECEKNRLLVRTAAGHTPGELVFEYEDSGRTALVGDNAFMEITPCPVLQAPPSEDEPRPRTLIEFNESLEELRDRGYDRLQPGHRWEIDDPAERITEILEHNEERTENVAEAVDGPTMAANVMEALFGDLSTEVVFPAMSEAIGHLEVLEGHGRVTRTERDGGVVFRPA